MRLKLLTLGVAIIIALAFRLIGFPDISRVVAAFLTGAGIVSGAVAGAVGIIVAVLIWWAVAYFVAKQLSRRDVHAPGGS
jgi:hypothetical protein